MTVKYCRLSVVNYPRLWEELRRWVQARGWPLSRDQFQEFVKQRCTSPIKTYPFDIMGDFWIPEDDLVWFTLRWS